MNRNKKIHAKKKLAVLAAIGVLGVGGAIGASAFFTDKATISSDVNVGTFGMKLSDLSDLDGTYTTWTSSTTETRVVTTNGKQTAKIEKAQATDSTSPSTGIINPGDVGILQFSIKNSKEKSMDTAVQVTLTSNVKIDSADAAMYKIEGLGEPTLSADGYTLTYPLTTLSTISGTIETEDGAEASNTDIYYAYNVPFSRLAGNKYQDANFTINVNAYAKQHRNSFDADWQSIGKFETSVSTGGSGVDGAAKDDEAVTPVTKTARLTDGETLNMYMKSLAGDIGPLSTSNTNTSITAIKMADAKPGDGITKFNAQTNNSDNEIYMWFDSGIIYFYSEGKINCTDLSQAFKNLTNLADISGLAEWNTSNVTNMYAMFSGCSSLENVNAIENWDTSNVTDMRNMFSGCTKLSDISGLKNWKTKSVVEMGSMFSHCTNLSDVSGLKDWDTSGVTNKGYLTGMGNMFSGCTKLSDISGLKDWDTSNVTNMDSMFFGCSSLENVNALENWNTSKVTNMSSMFSGCTKLSDISALSGENWNTSNVTNMGRMFSDCTNLSDISALSGDNWNTSNVTNMSWMFSNCSSLENVNALENWNTSKVTNMSSMFSGCTKLSDINKIKGWDVSGVASTDDGYYIGMRRMFYGCNCLEDVSGLNNWKVSASVKMDDMFSGTKVTALPAWYTT